MDDNSHSHILQTPKKDSMLPDTDKFPRLSRAWLRASRLAAVTALLSLSACVTSVVTPEQEARAGNSISQQVADQIGLYMDPELERYLDTVGQRLVDSLEETPYQFQFALVDQAEPNAFATPGGFIYVSRGLMAQINSEAELAGVLAH